MTEPNGADLEVRAEAWRLATIGENGHRLSQRAIAARLGVSQSTVQRYVAEGREAEAWVELFAKADLRTDIAYQLGRLARRWLARLEVREAPAEALTVEQELAITDRLLKVYAQLALLLGLNAPTRLALGADEGEPRTPDPQLVAEIERIRRVNAIDLESIRAGRPATHGLEE